MKFTIVFLSAIVGVLAIPTPQKSSCAFSANEKLNLSHKHDVNTGKLKTGVGKDGKATMITAPKIGGSGCSPAWAVGGPGNDDSPTPTKLGYQGGAGSSQPASGMAKGKGAKSGGHSH